MNTTKQGGCSRLIFLNGQLILRTGNSKTTLPQTLTKEGHLNALYLIAATCFFSLCYADGALKILLTVSFLSAVFKVIDLHELFLYQCYKQWKPK